MLQVEDSVVILIDVQGKLAGLMWERQQLYDQLKILLHPVAELTHGGLLCFVGARQSGVFTGIVPRRGALCCFAGNAQPHRSREG